MATLFTLQHTDMKMISCENMLSMNRGTIMFTCSNQ